MISRIKSDLGFSGICDVVTPSICNHISKFESSFASKFGQKHALAFPYGRTALIFLLKSLEIKGKEVICPAYTCVVVAHAILKSGNEPVFVDSCNVDFNMNLELVLGQITEKTGAIIATSIFGYPVDLDAIDAIREKYPHIYIIQDCAHSFSAKWKNRPVQKEGIAAFYGLNISKLVTSIFGGMVTTDNSDLANKIRSLRDSELSLPHWTKGIKRRAYLLTACTALTEQVYGATNWLEQHGFLNKFVKYYDKSEIDMPADYLEGMCDIEAKIGISQLHRYDRIIAHRKNIAIYYNKILKDIPDIKLPPIIEGATYSHYTICTSKKDKVINYALKKGVQLGGLIEYSIPKMEAYINRSGSQEDCPKAYEMALTTINLPLHINYKKADRIKNILCQSLAQQTP
jgi:perosamine synthetase